MKAQGRHDFGKRIGCAIGHPDAGPCSAILPSIIDSGQSPGQAPLAYLQDLLTRPTTMTNRDDLCALKPRAWKPASS